MLLESRRLGRGRWGGTIEFADPAVLVHHYLEGWAVTQLAKAAGVSDNVIRRVLREQGVALRGKWGCTGKPAHVRFFQKIVFTPTCWLWIGTLGADGYGTFNIGQKLWRAHVLAWTWMFGPVPAETLDHLCRMTLCVRPDHLEPVSLIENAMRGESIPAKNARKTHCLRGHEFTAENTCVHRDGHRTCRACRRVRWHLTHQ